MPTKFADAVEASVIDMYVNRELSSVMIAKELGIGTTTVFRYLERAGVTRDRDTRLAGKRFGRRLDTATKKEIAERYAAGESRLTLEGVFDCSGPTITKAIKLFGDGMRRQGQGSRKFSVEDIIEMDRQWEAGVSQTGIARHFHTHQSIIIKTFQDRGIVLETRRPSEDNHGSWKGGRVVNGAGYVSVLVSRNSPYARMRNSGNYVPEHRLVMAKSFGRVLHRSESVHHINGDNSDNRLENLQLRQGSHGKNVAFRCNNCGSCDVVPVPIASRPRK